jgi:hypothetical protein
MADIQLLGKSSKLLQISCAVNWLVCSVICLQGTHAFAQKTDLATKSEAELGFTLSYYKYAEPSYMTLKSNKLGISLSGTYLIGSQWPSPQQGWFVKGDLQTLNGKADYQSPFSGAISNTPNRSVEVQALIGRDFDLGGVVLAPYLGFGYRYLYSNIGYERTSSYKTLPIGLTHKMNASGLVQFHTTLEYMHLLSGEHKANLLGQNVILAQRRGYGLRLSLMRRQDSWSMGPTFTYWNMEKSELGGKVPVYEPHNNTFELGFKGAYRF